jgi:hypothetical protein
MPGRRGDAKETHRILESLLVRNEEYQRLDRVGHHLEDGIQISHLRREILDDAHGRDGIEAR